MKKGLANMWWIIIGAVIALVVLIVLMIIFTEGTGKFKTGLLSCENKGGECIDETVCKEAEGTVSKTFSCKKGLVCCFKSKET